MSDKVLFLDVDGVLNYYNPNIDHYDNSWICQDRLKLLAQIINKTGAKIVVSSTWRLYPKHLSILESHLRTLNLKITGVTKLISGAERAEEIEEWITQNDVEKFVIVDDDLGARINNESFFLTYYNEGLTQEIVDKIVEYFGEN